MLIAAITFALAFVVRRFIRRGRHDAAATDAREGHEA
jgi:hypothetical protein